MEKIIHEKYFHVDNGGFKFKVDEYGYIHIDFGFFGYSNTNILITGVDLKDLAKFFKDASDKMTAGGAR
jgi:predicted transcriptional regulator of viral defense system